MNFFRPCRYTTAPILETKFGFEHISEIGIFKSIKFCFSGKSLKFYQWLYSCLVCLIVCFSIYLDNFFRIWAGIVQLICCSGRLIPSFSFSSLICFSGLVLLCFLFRRRDFCYNHKTSQPLQSSFLFIRSWNFNWNACVTSFFALSGASFFCSIAWLNFWSHLTYLTLKNDFLTLKLTFIYFNSKR